MNLAGVLREFYLTPLWELWKFEKELVPFD